MIPKSRISKIGRMRANSTTMAPRSSSTRMADTVSHVGSVAPYSFTNSVVERTLDSAREPGERDGRRSRR